MAQPRTHLLRNIFLALFVFSSVFAIVLAVSGNPFVTTVSPPPTEDPNAPDNPESHTGSETASQNGASGFVMLAGSVITSVTSLVGFVVTTVITWRREKRDAAIAEVERKKLETELEKSRLELEQLKNNPPRKKGKR